MRNERVAEQHGKKGKPERYRSDERVEKTGRNRQSRSVGELEERAMKLAESAGRVRERRYAGTRVIEVAPIRNVAANVNATDVQGGRTATVAHKKSGETPERAETSCVRMKTVKIETAGEIKKVKSEKKKKRSERDRSENSNRRKTKSEKKTREPSMPVDSSEEEDETSPKRTSQDKKVKSRNKHRSSDTEGDIKKPKKVVKDKTCKDNDKMKKR